MTVTLSSGGASSGITEFEADKRLNDGKVYDLKGNLVSAASSDLSSLTPGIYIVNGHKTMVGKH